jgi:hypothetical protein
VTTYYTLPEFRKPLHHVLERGESVHALQRQICSQPLPSKRGRHAEELIATSGALTLVTNCVMAWNTQRLQRAVEREAARTAPRFSIDALKHIGPVGHRHINFRGTYRFPVDRYAQRLMRPAVGPSVVRRSAQDASFDTKSTRPSTDQLDIQRGLGCDQYQGYLHSPAVPASEIEGLIGRGTAAPMIDLPLDRTFSKLARFLGAKS